MRRSKEVLAVIVQFLFVLLILLSTFTYALFQGGTVSWTIFYVILPFVLYSLALLVYPLSNLTAERIVRTPNVENGGKLIVSLSISRTIRFPLLYTIATEQWEEVEMSKIANGKLKRLFLFGFKRKVEWEYEIEKMPRGQHVLQGVKIEVSDFFGWIKKTIFIEEKDTVLVFPKMSDIRYVPIDTQFDQGSMESPLHIVKDTTMATGVRDYQAGDRVTWIHWKSFARTQTLMTKEFEDRRSQDLFVILDGKASETFEEQVELAASLLKEAANHQAGLSFLTTGEATSLFPFIQSEEQLHSAYVHLAKIKPSTEGVTHSTVDFATSIQQGGTILMITGNPDAPFIESVLLNVQNRKTVICFVIQKQNEVLSGEVQRNMEFAKSKGVDTHVLRREQFTQAFKGVTRK